MHFRLLYACLFATHLICRVILQLLLYRSVHVIITCLLRSVIFFVCSVSLKFARVGTIIKLVFMKLSKKHVGPDTAVESTTGGGEKEAKPSVPLEVGYVARLPVMESKSCPIRKKEKKYTLRPRKQLPSCARESIDAV